MDTPQVTPDAPPAADPTAELTALKAQMAEATARAEKAEQRLGIFQRGYDALKASGDPKVIAFFEQSALGRPAEYPKASFAPPKTEEAPEEYATPEQKQLADLRTQLDGLKTLLGEKFAALQAFQQSQQNESAWTKAEATVGKANFDKYRAQIEKRIGGQPVTDPELLITLYKAARHDDLERATASASPAEWEAIRGPRPSGAGALTPDLTKLSGDDVFRAALRHEAAKEGVSMDDINAFFANGGRN